MRKKCKILFILTLVAGILFSVEGARAQEGEDILSYDTVITVYSDATMRVTEIIKVRSTGDKIKRGIYRDFPTHYKDRYGNNYMVSFGVESVLRDGQPEPYRVVSRSNGKRIYMGDTNIYLPPGLYTYTIVYQTNRQLGFFEDHDELYWNAIGHGWTFPIHAASALVELPAGAVSEIQEMTVYTGYQGSRQQDAVVSQDILGNPVFTATRTLRPNEGITIVVSWPKGYVTEPSAMRRLGYFLSDNRWVVFAFLVWLGLLLYYLTIWYLLGRDPKKGTIIALYHPPEKFSPALTRYVLKMGYDHRVLSAAVLNMAVKGFLVIEQKALPGIFSAASIYVLRKTKTTDEALSTEEKKVAEDLFGSSDEIELKNTNHLIIGAAVARLRKLLRKQSEEVYFFTNSGYFILGILLTFLFGFFSFIVIAEASPLFGILMLASAGIMNVVFYHLLKAPTLQGRRVMDKIEGFKMFLCVAEKDRMNVLHPPEKTPELFERYLPYALALDVEQKWAEQFAQVFRDMAAQGKEYRPHWCHGTFGRDWDCGRFASDLGSGFSNAIASSATAPGSSSGAGGGGCSGGGGGGGGGGGW